MPWWRKKPKRSTLPEKLEFSGIEHPYGLHPDNPVLCGRGVEGEVDFLNRLRCPTGKPIRYERQGSFERTDIGYLERPDVHLSVSRGKRRRLGEDYDVRGLPLDAYLYICDCDQHRGRLFIDMYFRGPERPIAEDGWVLFGASTLPEEQTANCPYCDRELRTPAAKQCRFCKMDWHDPSNVHHR